MSLLGNLLGGKPAASPDEFPNPAIDVATPEDGGEQVAILAGGCFWCVEAVFKALDGVTSVTSGYTGDTAETADYRTVCSGTTNHAEVVAVRFDPRRITYGQLLKVFFSVAHDPTQLDRQGADVGRQYRSAIFHGDGEQKRVAEAYIEQLELRRAEPGSALRRLHDGPEDGEAAEALRRPAQGRVLKAETDRRREGESHRSAAGYDITPLTEGERAELAKTLSAEERRVILDHGTERPFCGLLLHNKEAGVYGCRLCGLPLYRSGAKFESGTGWPSFTEHVDPDHIAYVHDRSHGMVRTEIRCRRCGGHLGHAFDDGPPPTGERHCLNSVSLAFHPESAEGAAG
jgi:methionine-R-sulfoxide reductase/methionine-S-sulfoxide reductase